MKRKSDSKSNRKLSIFGTKGFRMSEMFLNMAAEDESDLVEFDRIQRSNERSGCCEDDYEFTAPFVDMLPEEAYDKEDVSPLRF